MEYKAAQRGGIQAAEAAGRQAAAPPPSPLPIEGAARWAMVLITIAAFTGALSVIGDLRYYNAVGDVMAGRGLSPGDAQAIDDLRHTFAIAELVTYIAAAIPFLIWFRRAYGNVRSLGYFGLRFTPGWAIGAWFVPFLAWIRPKAIANDIWRASDPAGAGGDGEQWSARPVAGIVHWWWALWLVSRWGEWIASRLVFGADTLSDHRAAAATSLIADGLVVLSGATAVLFVRALTDRQNAAISHEGLAWA